MKTEAMQNDSGCTHASAAWGPGRLQEWPNRCSVPTTSLPPRPGASLSGSVGPEGPIGATVGPAQAVSTAPSRSVASLFASDNMEGVETQLLGTKSFRRISQQVSSVPRPVVAEAALPGSGGDTGSATSASDGTVQCPELPATRNLSTSPMNSPLPQNSAVAASGSVAFLPDLCSPQQRQLTTPAAHVLPATAAAAACSEAADAGLASKLQPNSGGAGAACEMEDVRPSSSWRIEPEALKQEAMQGLASKNPHLPQPVRVTVGPNAFRQQQQQLHHNQQSSLQSQQQQNVIPSATKKRGREAGGALHRQWGLADGDDSDGQKKRGGSSRGAGGRGARRDADDIEDKPPVFGMFYPDRYMVGVDCILVDGMFVSRSRFEKLGGSLMAKWYRSIRVVDTAEPLGAWLERHNLPVFTGKARQRRQRGPPSTSASAAAAAAAAASAAAAANANTAMTGNADKNRGSSNNLGLGIDAGTSACGTDSTRHAGLDVKTEPESFGATDAGPAVGEALIPGHGGTGGSGSDEGLAADPSVTQRSRRPGFPADKVPRLEGALGLDNAGFWQGVRPLMLGQGSIKFGIQLCDTEALNAGFNAADLQQSLHASSGNSAVGSEQSPRGTVVVDGTGAGSAGAGVACAAGGSSGGANADRLAAGVSAARNICAGLETLPNGAVAPGVYLIGGRVAPEEHAAQQPAEQHHYKLLQRLQPPFSQQLSQQQQHQPQLDHQQKLQQQQQQQQQQFQGHLHQRPQQGFQQPASAGGRYFANDSYGPLSPHDLAPNSVHGAPTQLSNLSHTTLAARDSLGWGPVLPASNCPPDGAAGPPTGVSVRRFGSDGDAGLAAGAQQQGCTAAPKLATEATGVRVSAAMGKVAGVGGCGEGGVIAGCTQMGELLPTPASSCRLPESTSLDSVPTTASSRWPSSSFALSPGAGGLMQCNSIDPGMEGGGIAGRHDWDAEAWAYPCGSLQPVMSAPGQIQTPVLYCQHELQQQQPQKQLYPAMSRQQVHDLQLGTSPPAWPQPRVKPQQQEPARAVQSPFVQVQQHGTEQQSLQGYSSSFSVSEGPIVQSQLQNSQGGVSAATAMAPPPLPEAADAGLPYPMAPPALGPAASAEASDTQTQLASQRSGHMYPPSARPWPYGNHYWPCHPYPPGHTRGVPGMPPRLPAGPGAPVRPYPRNMYPREMTPGGATPPASAPAPAPAPFTPPYGYYYTHPHPRRGPPPTIYRRRYTAAGPGTAEAPPGIYGARYDPTAMCGTYALGRPEMEAPMDGSAAGAMLYPTTSACLDDVGLSVANTSACMPPTPSVSRAPPASAVAASDSPGATAVPAAGAASGRMSSDDAVTSQAELQPPSLPLQQPQQQHRGISTAASMAAAYPSNWASTPQHVSRPFPTNCPNQLPQHLHEGSFGLGMGMGLTSSGTATSYRPQTIDASSAVADAGPSPGPPSAGVAFSGRPAASSAAATATAAGSGLFVPPSTGSAATAASVSGAAVVFSAMRGADGDVDPMWAHFQCWSAEEATRASQYM